MCVKTLGCRSVACVRGAGGGLVAGKQLCVMDGAECGPGELDEEEGPEPTTGRTGPAANPACRSWRVRVKKEDGLRVNPRLSVEDG